MKYKIILASKSPRRKELLESIGYSFKCVNSDFDETTVDKQLPIQLYVQQLAMFKAYYAAREVKQNSLVIGADTVVYSGGKILGKPNSRGDAYNMLKSLSGKTHLVYTGIAVIRRKDFKTVTAYEKTEVFFKTLTDSEIYTYIDSCKPYDKAGAYGIQEYAKVFVEKINGDYFNVVGLPVCRLNSIIQNEFGEG